MKHNAFRFHRTFDARATNEDVYECCARPLVLHALRGGFATCMMYGQTGSGKTYTMCSIYEQASRDLFHKKSDKQVVSVSFVEVAGDRCSDLLNGYESAQLLSAKNGSFQAFPLVEPVVSDVVDLLAVIRFGCAMRATEATGVHDASSRSHAILRVYVQNCGGDIADGDSKRTDAKDPSASLEREGTLTLVDLAGSEHRIDSMYHSAQLRKECAHINASLMALKKCVRAHMKTARRGRGGGGGGGREKEINKHVYRASKLTMALKSSFALPGAQTVVIATVSPTSKDTEHSLSTLRHVGLMIGTETKKAALRNPATVTNRTSPASKLMKATLPTSSPDVSFFKGGYVQEVQVGRINVTREARRLRGQSDDIEKKMRSNGNAFGSSALGSSDDKALTAKHIARQRRKREICAFRSLTSPQRALLNNARSLLRGQNTLQQRRFNVCPRRSISRGLDKTRVVGNSAQGSAASSSTTVAECTEQSTTSDMGALRTPSSSGAIHPESSRSKQKGRDSQKKRAPRRRRSGGENITCRRTPKSASPVVITKSRAVALKDLRVPIRGKPGSAKISATLQKLKLSLQTKTKSPRVVDDKTTLSVYPKHDRCVEASSSTIGRRCPRRRKSSPSVLKASVREAFSTPHTPSISVPENSTARLRARKYKTIEDEASSTSPKRSSSSEAGDGHLQHEKKGPVRPPHFDVSEWSKIPPEYQAIIARQYDSNLATANEDNGNGGVDGGGGCGGRDHVNGALTIKSGTAAICHDEEEQKRQQGDAHEESIKPRTDETSSPHVAKKVERNLVVRKRPGADSLAMTTPNRPTAAAGPDSVVTTEIRALEEKIAKTKSAATRSGLKKRLAAKRAVLIRKKRKEEMKLREAAKRASEEARRLKELENTASPRFAKNEATSVTRPVALSPLRRTSPAKEMFVWDESSASEGQWGVNGEWIPRS
eukprot:g1655.t1